MPTPPLAITGTDGGLEHETELVEVGALHRAVAADLGDDERGRRPRSSNRRDELEEVGAAALDPSPRRRPRARARRGRPRRGPGCSAQSSSTSSGCSTAAVPTTTRVDARERAARRPRSTLRTPPPDCDLAVDTPRRSPRSRARLRRLARARGVEIDDVDPRRARGRERRGPPRPGRRRRRSRRRSRPGGGARTARAQVDRRVELEAAAQRRALGRRDAACLRSAPRRAARAPRP